MKKSNKNINTDCDEIAGEVWLDINNIDGYQISSHGRVRSNKVRRGLNLPESGWRLIHPGKDKDGYRRYTFHAQEKKHYKRISVLVAEHFISEKPKGCVVRHKNGVNTDDYYENLEYGTQKQNIHDKWKHGTMPLGENHTNSKLTKSKVVEIRSSNLSLSALAKKYGVHKSTIHSVVSNITWRNV